MAIDLVPTDVIYLERGTPTNLDRPRVLVTNCSQKGHA